MGINNELVNEAVGELDNIYSELAKVNIQMVKTNRLISAYLRYLGESALAGHAVHDAVIGETTPKDMEAVRLEVKQVAQRLLDRVG